MLSNAQIGAILLDNRADQGFKYLPSTMSFVIAESRLLSFSKYCFLLLGLVFLSSCASGGKGAHIDKVSKYSLFPGVRLETEDPMIAFERQHRLYGALENEDYLARFGQYFTVFTSLPKGTSDAVVRFEYRAQTTGATVHTQELPVPTRGWGGKKVEFQVVGEDFEELGEVLAWRMVLLVAGEEVAETRSFLWKD